jgi:DNA-binding transcriptional regulator YdaS (Cro superfamily)
MDANSTVWAAVLEAVGGKVAELARRCNAMLPPEEQLSSQAVHKWAVRVPADRVLLVEGVTGVSRHVLRPDVFGPAPQAASAKVAA